MQVKSTSKQNHYRHFPDINKMCINPIAWSPVWGRKTVMRMGNRNTMAHTYITYKEGYCMD